MFLLAALLKQLSLLEKLLYKISNMKFLFRILFVIIVIICFVSCGKGQGGGAAGTAGRYAGKRLSGAAAEPRLCGLPEDRDVFRHGVRPDLEPLPNPAAACGGGGVAQFAAG